MRRLLQAVSLLLVLSAPALGSASAEAPSRVEANLLFVAPPLLDGAVEVAASWSAMDLSQLVSRRGTLDLSWDSAAGFVVERVREVHTLGGVEARVAVESRNTTFSLDAGSLGDLQCTADCIVLAYARPGDDARLGLRGFADGAPLAWDLEQRNFHSGMPEELTLGMVGQTSDTFNMWTAPGWIAATGDEEGSGLSLRDAAPFAEGHVSLFLWNATGTILEERRSTRFATGEADAPRSGLAPLVAGHSSVGRFMVLHLRGARLAGDAGGAATLYAPEADVALVGNLTSAAAWGSLRQDAHARRGLDAEALRLEGSFVLRARYEGDLDRGVDLEEPPTTPAEREGLSAAVSGDAMLIRVGSVPPVTARAADKAAAIAAGVGALGLLAALLLRGVFAPLYTRVPAPGALANENRRRILEALRETPGVHATELARALGLARVVVQYHMGVLERHALVRATTHGRVRRFFLADGAADAHHREAQSHLRVATRRVVARALVEAAAPQSQRALVEATGLAQTVVSYHLARLVDAGLVETISGWPRAYAATPVLARALERDGSAERSMSSASLKPVSGDG